MISLHKDLSSIVTDAFIKTDTCKIVKETQTLDEDSFSHDLLYRYLIFGDIHGRDITEISFEIMSRKPNCVICLGDFDFPDNLRNYMTLEKNLNRKGIQTIYVPGNHENTIVNREDNVFSECLKKINTSIVEQTSRFHETEFKEQLNYISQLLNEENSFKTINIGGLRSLVMHAAPVGTIEYSGPKDAEKFWTRILDEEDVVLNHNILQEYGYKILLRGHDHVSRYSTVFPNGDIYNKQNCFENSIPLCPNSQHIITVGGYYFGEFATIDEFTNQSPRLTFHQLPDSKNE